jgi:hypothetical protein
MENAAGEFLCPCYAVPCLEMAKILVADEKKHIV